MTIKQHGGVFGRNPTFNEIGGTLTTVAQPNITSLGTQTSNLAFADGNGIDFSATSDAAGKDNELLDDYEEGAWTVQLEALTTNFSSVSYSGNTARYTKVGNTVHISGRLVTTGITVGSASGNLAISGLPYDAQAGSCSFADTRSWNTNNPTEGYFSGNKILLFYKTSANGNSSALPYTSATTSGVGNVITFAGSYHIS